MSSTKKVFRIGAVPALVAGLAMPALFVTGGSGCDDNPLDTLCCSDFDVGADLSGVNFEADATFNAWIQAVADFSGVANAMVTDVSASCRALAIDLGADQEQPDEPSAPDEKVAFWCNLAVAQINAEIVAEGSLTITAQPPSCTVDVQAQASCEGGCTVDAQCDPGGVEVRCTGGELKGKCEGSCSGKCEGSANLAVACEGSCSGTCEGTCSGNCSAEGPGGSCKGSCDGTCEGECRGECEMEAGAEVECSGECSGGCDVELKAPKCEGEIDPPQCDVDADCQASCEASASAKAECKPPSIEIAFSGTIDAAMNAKLGALKLHLPNIFLAARAKGEALVATGEAVFNLSLELDPGSLSGKAAVCVIPAASAIGQAFVNAEAGVSASLSVVTAVGG